MCVTFFCEADFINFDYFIIDFSDHSAHFKYQILAKITLFPLVTRNTILLESTRSKRNLGSTACFELNPKENEIPIKLFKTTFPHFGFTRSIEQIS